MPAPEPAGEPAHDQDRRKRAQPRGAAEAHDTIERATERAGQAVAKAQRAVDRATQKVVVADPRGIRALAHPARIEAIDRLYAGDIMTATELASAADVSPSAMSYHLRELAKWGVIERVDDGSDGRERRWRAAGSDLQIGAKDGSGKSTAGRAAHMALSRQLLDRTATAIEQHMRRGEEEPEEWRAAMEINTYDVVLTKDEMNELGDRMRELLETYSPRRADPPEGARTVRVLTVIVPTR